MAIQHMYAIVCDVCQQASKAAHTVADAAKNAQERGYRSTSWLHGEVPEQTWTCSYCVSELIEKQRGLQSK